MSIRPEELKKRKLIFTDLADFAQGDIQVYHAVDSNMTFVVPLAAAVVERRGGMLIHGAITAPK
jgi:pyruvate,water dikinase